MSKWRIVRIIVASVQSSSRCSQQSWAVIVFYGFASSAGSGLATSSLPDRVIVKSPGTNDKYAAKPQPPLTADCLSARLLT